MLDNALVRRCGGAATVMIGGIGTAGIALAPPAAAVHAEQYISTYCRPATDQDCRQPAVLRFDLPTDDWVQPSFTNAADGCSDISVRFSVSPAGTPGTLSSSYRLSPGQTAVGPHAHMSAGAMQVSVFATGIEGGCNTGALMAWGGTVSVDSTGKPNLPDAGPRPTPTPIPTPTGPVVH